MTGRLKCAYGRRTWLQACRVRFFWIEGGLRRLLRTHSALSGIALFALLFYYDALMSEFTGRRDLSLTEVLFGPSLEKTRYYGLGWLLAVRCYCGFRIFSLFPVCKTSPGKSNNFPLKYPQGPGKKS